MCIRDSVEGVQAGERQPRQEVFLKVTHSIFHAPFFVGFEWAASLDHEAVVAGKVQVTRMQHGRCSKWMGQDRSFAVVDHDLGRNGVKVFEGVLVLSLIHI